MSATAYTCPANATHLNDSEGGGVETQLVAPGAALDGCSFRALANNPRGFDRAKWIIKIVGRNAINE
jgi:hypothetical protein